MHINNRVRSRLGTQTILFCCALTLSGCVSSTIDTPEGFVSTLEQPTAADVLTLDDTGTMPTPAARPGTELAAFSESSEPSVETPSAEDNIAVASLATPPSSDPATQRIDAAVAAPLANGAQAPAVQRIVATAPTPIIATAPAKASTQTRPGLLTSLFGKRGNKPPAPIIDTQAPVVKVATVSTPKVTVAAPKPKVVVATASASGSTASLPGVNRNRALGVNKNAKDTAPIQVASAAGLSRLAPNGIRTQHAGVDVKCLKPALVRMLKTVERKFGRPVVVTSGYRSSTRNRKARGAKNSLHIYCAAADIQVEGVSKWQLAKYLRSVPGRGGVGTYCHTKSVHIDIGPNRDWNWRCRRKKK